MSELVAIVHFVAERVNTLADRPIAFVGPDSPDTDAIMVEVEGATWEAPYFAAGSAIGLLLDWREVAVFFLAFGLIDESEPDLASLCVWEWRVRRKLFP